MVRVKGSIGCACTRHTQELVAGVRVARARRGGAAKRDVDTPRMHDIDYDKYMIECPQMCGIVCAVMLRCFRFGRGMTGNV